MTAVMELRREGRPFTRADLESTPDDGRRYELVDGSMLVTPSPSIPHQITVGEVYELLRHAAPPGFLVLTGPVAVEISDDTELQPDVLVATRTDFTHDGLPVPPLLAVEVLSPSTRAFDLHTKRARYEEFGAAAYWVVDPLIVRLRAWDLRDGAFVEVADVTGDEPYEAAVPFPVTVVPAGLVVD